MSLAIWPPLTAADRRIKEKETQERELQWIANETIEICRDLKHGLEDCYALLAPIDPGSTLVMSTPRNEKVKGIITRVGTRIVKSSLNLQLRVLPPQSLTLDPNHAIHIPPLDGLHAHLTRSIDLLAQTLAPPADPRALAATLGQLAAALTSSIALLKGPPLTGPDPAWQTASAAPHLFAPPLGPNLSLHFSLQECSIVLTIRSLELVDAPVHFGMKLGLAIGTVRRLEHDEMDTVFKYRPGGDGSAEPNRSSAGYAPEPPPDASDVKAVVDVYVREKVRVESADPSLISLHSKLGFLSHVLGQTRRNLAAVMGTDID